MGEVKMPEPTAWMLALQTMGGDVGWKLSWSQSGAGVCNRLSGKSHEKPLITTDQAEAYAQARVNKTLETIAQLAHEKSNDALKQRIHDADEDEENDQAYNLGQCAQALAFTIMEREIRALKKEQL